MKKIRFWVCCLSSLFVSFAFSRTETTSAMQMCRTVEIALYEDFILAGKPLPKSFEDMPFLRECAEHQWAQLPHEFELLNDLAIVPNAPLIKKEQGIPLNHVGSRLFAISRTWNFDYAKNGFDASDPMAGGRFIILISDNPPSVAPSWIPEQEARNILTQVKDFDPTKQPRSFDDFAKKTRAEITDKEAKIKKMHAIWGNSPQANFRDSSKIIESYGRSWIIGAFTVLVLLILFAILRIIRSQNSR